VVAKRLGQPYRSGERTAMVKVKRARTADCVVAGFRRGKEGREVASLLLGLYADDGLLHYAGHASGFARPERARLTSLLEPLASDSSFTGDAPGGPSRWARGRSMEWTPVRPVLVVEVEWRHATGGRFRHGVRVLRFRPDKAPEQCTFAQMERGEASAEEALSPPRA
jgi:ATP-dependent DNA ligase